MALNSYSALQTSIASWLNRSDLTSEIPDFVSLLEASLQRREEIRTETSTTITLGTASITLPTDLHEIQDLYYDSDPYFGPIDIVSAENVAWFKQLGTGLPRMAAILEDGATLYLGPAPDASYTANLAYIASFSPLSSSNTTNWILTSHPDVYLYGSLVHAEGFLKNDERIPTWEKLYEKALRELDLFCERRKYGGRLVKRQRRSIG